MPAPARFSAFAAAALPRIWGRRPRAEAIHAAWTEAERDVSRRVLCAALREQLVAGRWDEVAEVPGLGRLDLRRRAYGLHEPLAGEALPPGELWPALARRAGVSPVVVERVLQELASGVWQLALALLARDLRDELAQQRRADPRFNDPEHWITHGHPWHPMARTRLGWSVAQSATSAPEQAARADVFAIDVPRSQAQVHGDGDAWASLLGVARRDHVRIPVLHPQRRRLARRLPAELLARCELVPAPPLRARSLASMRTVVPCEHPETHLKLAADLLTTSARRVVSPQSVANGPLFTQLLSKIAALDPEVAPLEILGERATVGLHPELPHAAELAAILRVVPARAGETWICAALGERRPGAASPLIRELVTACGDGEALLRLWMEGLARPTFRLLTAWGVALEPHLQNTLVVVRQGAPAGFRVRDLGGIRIHRPRLRARGLDVAVAAGSFTVTDDVATARNKLFHCLLHAHLAHVVRLLDGLPAPLGVSEDRAWQVVAAHLRRWFSEWRASDPEAAAACEEDERVCFAARHEAKALFTMRLQDASSDYSYVLVDNPLHR
jgi:siderophore synthetase component